VAGPAMANSLRPIVVLVRGMTSAPLFADCSCYLLTTDETGVHTSAKYTILSVFRQHLKTFLFPIRVSGCTHLIPYSRGSGSNFSYSG